MKAVGRITIACQHVMPLKDLMQNNAVEETAEAKAKQYASRNGEFSLFHKRLPA
jgi:hypothetical protein